MNETPMPTGFVTTTPTLASVFVKVVVTQI
jgi:hypothetical protein